MFYSLSAEGVWLHLYAAGVARLRLAGGQTVTLTQHTRYPWDGEVVVDVEADGPFSLFVRIPAWCEVGAAVEVNGGPFSGAVEAGTYAEIRRTWQPGDQVSLSLPMPVRRVECHPYAADNAGRVALQRGPFQYCVEGADNPGLDLRDLVLPASGELAAPFRPGLLGGVVALHGPAALVLPGEGWEGRLYRTARPVDEQPAGRPAGPERVELAAIPYYAWANREPGPMEVWLRTGPV